MDKGRGKKGRENAISKEIEKEKDMRDHKSKERRLKRWDEEHFKALLLSTLYMLTPYDKLCK